MGALLFSFSTCTVVSSACSTSRCNSSFYIASQTGTSQSSAAKQKQAVGTGIQRKLVLYDLRQAIYSAPQICISTGDVDVLHLPDVTQHYGSPG